MSSGCTCKTTKNKRTNNSSDSDSDVWASESDVEERFEPKTNEFYGLDNTPMHINLVSLKRKHGKQGYLDGLSQSKEESLQKGFDDGYPLGAKIGEKIGQLLAEVSFLKFNNQIEEKTYDEAMSDLAVTNVLSFKYFSENLSLTDILDHPVIKKWTKKLSSINSME